MVKKLTGNNQALAGCQVDITLAASVTTDGMDIAISFSDVYDGNPIQEVIAFDWYISEAATGAGVTADTYSGDVTTVTGTELQEITSKKYFTATTTATGTYTALAVDSANPTDQYVCVVHPATGEVIVSVASGTNWEGA